ncbi:hypothetical protein K443DRAFT_418955 [Laccaria amethystina LaAM-08-1]|uniref:Unplaced genomic scaffold K443scaffold_342, whole genome shotgun sequence n=1 Tax=Laccaria amethystina LaAM-08-1 TaxID=1095629 RepID=A0A0C9WVV8_9AGAR|nr:hypothetical protein K443DRAFT_418955 [Laccaria amethystina LaAM-08-1]
MDQIRVCEGQRDGFRCITVVLLRFFFFQWDFWAARYLLIRISQTSWIKFRYVGDE